MNWVTIKTIYLKELLDTVRDRRTLIAMIGVPIVLYPALIIAVTQIALVERSIVEETASKIAIASQEYDTVAQWFDGVDMVELSQPEDPDGALAAEEVDAIVRTDGPVASTLEEMGRIEVTIAYDASVSASREAAARAEDGLRNARETILTNRLETRGLTMEFAQPIQYERKNEAPPSKMTGSFLGVLLPMLMVLMLGVGAIYPAMDLTAGEKERGTFETLLSTPCSKMEIVSGKFLAVFTLSFATGMLNLASMLLTLGIQFSQMLGSLGDNDRLNLSSLADFSPWNALAMLAVMVPLSFLISAMMMTVALMARSFKEASNFVTPVFLVIVIPAGAGMVPSLEFSPSTQFLPIVNIALLFRDLLMGKGGVEGIFIVFLCTAVYATLALVVASWFFQREEIILADEGGIPFTVKRSLYSPSEAPTPGFALGLMAIVMLLIYYVQGYAIGWHIRGGLLLTQWFLILAPILGLLWFFKIDIAKTLNLRGTRPGALAGAAIATVGTLLLVIEWGVFQNKVLPFPEEFLLGFEKLFSSDGTALDVAVLLVIIALSPAICEEALFRGVMVSSLRPKMPAWAVVLVVGIAFGLFHMSVFRVVPTALLGIVLTYYVVRTGSIWPGVIGHGLNNGLSILVQTQSLPAPTIEWMMSQDLEQHGLPWWLLGLAVVFLVAGVALLESSIRGATPKTPLRPAMSISAKR